MKGIDAIRLMQTVRRLARIQPVASLEERLAEIHSITGPARPATTSETPRRTRRGGLDRMDRSGQDRSE